MSNLVPVSEIERMAGAVAKSGLFGIRTHEQAVALMLIAQAEGLHPAIAARDYHVINGRPTLKADAMLARFQQAGGSVKWGKLTDESVTGTFSHAQGGSAEITWTIDMAQRAGLLSNPTWKKYPRQMLRARVISEGIRTVFPGVTVGVYTPEEMEDIAAEQKGKPAPPPSAPEEPKNMGPANVIDDDQQAQVAELDAKIKAAKSADELEALRQAIRELHGEQRKDMIDRFMDRLADLQLAEEAEAGDAQEA